MAEPIKIDIWSDIACPWCYLGKRRLEMAVSAFRAAKEALEVALGFRSFQLLPDMPDDYPGTHEEFLAERFGWSAERVRESNERMIALGRPVGIEYNMAPRKMANTFKAHELLHHAKAHGRQAEMKERLLKAHFTDGRHVGQVDELAMLAGEIGLDPDDARQSLEASAYRQAVEADIQQAIRYGIRGVPFFVIDGRYGVSGAQEVETFREALTAVARQRKAT